MHWIVILLILVMACEKPTDKKAEAPIPVQLVLREAGADTLASEPGIDAVPTPEGEPNQIQIQWYRHPQVKNLKKFNIYRSEDPLGMKNYQVVGSLQANLPGQVDSIYFDTQDLRINVRYYYYVTAVNKDLLESGSSDTVSYMLTEKAAKLSLNGNATVIRKPKFDFEWWMESGNTPDQYILRIERFFNSEFHPLVYVNQIKSTYQTPQVFHLEGDFLRDLLPNGKYRWRIDCLGREDVENQYFEGSESNWEIFEVIWGN
ncbi:MAG: hypothetical protein GXO77_10905 [Calditrichaeota bacterium]|nr:hypothetical protein [Calditrichota bacterium]